MITARARRFAGFALLPLIIAACSPEEPRVAQGEADTVFVGGPVYTASPARPQVEAVSIRGERIVAVGSRAEVMATAAANTRVIELNGAALFPGFVDSHAHLFGVGMSKLTLNLEGVGSIAELVEAVAAAVAESEPGATVYGRGWIETGWPENRFPNRDDLDPSSQVNPVVLVRADGHAALVNSAALAAAGVDDATPDPEGGRIERGVDGRASGLLIDRAMDKVANLISAPSAEQREHAYAVGARTYAAFGWTGLHNMSVDPDDVAIMTRLAEAQAIPIRVYNALDAEGLDWLVENAPYTDGTGRIVTRAMKLYVDGALGSRGAALHEPYADRPDTAGLLLLHKDQALSLFRRALEAGVQVCTHAIGDRGNRLVLDWYAEAMQGYAGPAPRWRIEHAQIVDPADIPRFEALGIIASMQPSHAIGDLYFAPARLGPDRLDGAYAWRRMVDAGAVIAGGSDAPVERGDPRIEFYAAVARRSLNGFQGPDWRPDQALTRAEALALFTRWPAYASFRENDLGTIEPGKRADFTVFSRDIMTIPEADILNVSVVMTVVDGEIVYRQGETSKSD